jgi:hypothetical protein
VKPKPCRTCQCDSPCVLGEAWLEERDRDSDEAADRAGDEYERWLDSRW